MLGNYCWIGKSDAPKTEYHRQAKKGHLFKVNNYAFIFYCTYSESVI